MKYIYFFGAGKAEGTSAMRELLGGKGAGLAEMTRIGLPVPGGFTITTHACAYYLKNKKYPRELHAAVALNLARLEKLTRRKLGDAENPLLVSADVFDGGERAAERPPGRKVARAEGAAEGER